jgi:hypothetical protein
MVHMLMCRRTTVLKHSPTQVHAATSDVALVRIALIVWMARSDHEPALIV